MRYLDVGASPEQVGLNITADTESRYLLAATGRQTIRGPKTMQTPAMSPIFPKSANDAVPKKAFAEKVRCIGNTVVYAFTINAKNIQDKYITLVTPIAPNQAASLEILSLDGAAGLAFNQDFGVKQNPNGEIDKLTWEGYELERPGAIFEGQIMIISYVTCRESLYDNSINTNKLFLARVPRVPRAVDAMDGANQALHDAYAEWVTPPLQIKAKDSEQQLELLRLSNGEIRRVTLPTISGDFSLTLSSFKGRLILYAVPTLGVIKESLIRVMPPSDSGMTAARSLELEYPFVSKTFRVYEYSPTQDKWVFRLEHDIAADLEPYRSYRLFSFGRYLPIYMRILPLPNNRLGIYASWAALKPPSYEQENMQTVAILKTFDSEYGFVKGYKFAHSGALQNHSPWREPMPLYYNGIPRVINDKLVPCFGYFYP